MSDATGQARVDRTRIKICGIQDIESAHAACDAGADAIGFIFASGSPRLIDPDTAFEIMMRLPPLVQTVSVTRDLSVDAFSELEQMCPTNLSQLHGSESERTVRACGPNVVKAFKFDEVVIDTQLSRWGAVEEVDAVLIDGSEGGTGTTLDWAALADHLAKARQNGFDKPVFLAGGLDPDNVTEAIRVVRPFAVDVSSGVESAPGVKDLGAIRAFGAAVRAADASPG